MKKDINFIWILYAIMSLIFLTISCMECVNSQGILAYTLVPTVFAAVVFTKKEEKLIFVGTAILLLQALMVTFIDRVLVFIDELLASIGDKIGNYTITSIGCAAAWVSWMLVAYSLIFVYYSLLKTKELM